MTLMAPFLFSKWISHTNFLPQGFETKQVIPPFQHQCFKSSFYGVNCLTTIVLATEMLASHVKYSNNKAPETGNFVYSFKMTSFCNHGLLEPQRTSYICSYDKLVQGMDTIETAITIETKYIAMETQDTLYCYARTAVSQHCSAG